MSMRKHLPNRKSKKIFTKGAVKTPKMNVAARPMRGGYRI